MEKQDILIRLLKDGHINEEEFKLLYPSDIKVEYVPINVPEPNQYPLVPDIWHGINDPLTGDPIGPFYYIN